MNLAILSVGNIANKMAETVSKMNDVCAYAVSSRSIEKAEYFAKKWHFKKFYGSYEEMLMDKNIDLVYICTPHNLHYKYAKMCLEYNKNVLVEKPFTTNANEALELIEIAQNKKLLLAEAIWTRYMPSRKILDDILSSNVIGDVNYLSANLGYPLTHINRLNVLDLAGGALLDLGVYTINFALMAIKDKIIDITTNAIISESGIDLSNSITLTFENNKMAILHSNMTTPTNRLGLVCGKNGYIEVQNINNCEEIRVYDINHNIVKKYPIPKQITGFEYQVRSCMNAIKNRKYECDEMNHSEILKVMKIMDEIRSKWNMKFPWE